MSDRPSWRSVVWRVTVVTVVTVVTAFALWLLAAIVPGFSIDSGWDAVLAGFAVGVGNAIIWPAMAFLVVPLSVVTLGLGAIVLNAVFVGWLLERLPVERHPVERHTHDRHRIPLDHGSACCAAEP